MLKPQTIKRLVACFGSIQLVTALSVLNYREQEQRKLNLEYENYLVITPLWASQEQNAKFAAFIEKMANSIGSWKKIVYIPLEEIKSIAKKCKHGNFSRIASLVHKLLGIEVPDEIYLSREWMFENKLLMNVYEAAEKICYGDGIGIYFSQSAFPTSRSPQNLYSYLASKYRVIKRSLKKLIYKTQLQSKNKFDLGYFSLPYAFGEIPPMKTVILDKIVFLRTFQILKKSLENLIDINCIYNLCEKIENIPVSILLTSNFSEALGRISLENEIAAYRELLESHGIPESSILLIKPHPRDSRKKNNSVEICSKRAIYRYFPDC